MGQGASSIACASARDQDEDEDEDFLDRENMLAQIHMQQQQQKRQSLKIEPENYTSWLPDECLAYIFQKMGTSDRNGCSLVCKRWHFVEAQGRQRLSLLAKAEIASYIPAIFTRFDNITKLALRADRKASSINDKAFFLVGRHCTQLSKLKIKGCKQITDDGVELFAKLRGSTLKKLSCASCNFGARGLNAIMWHCTLLEELTIKRLKGLNEDANARIGPGSGMIRRLCLKELNNAQVFCSLIEGSKNLRTLIICGNSGNWDYLLDSITKYVPSLVELHVESLQHVSDRGLQKVARCTRLEVLYVVKIPDFTNFGLSDIAEGCKRLRKLHIDGWKSGRIGDEGLISLAMKCRDLQEVVLIGVNATAASLGLMASNCLGLERLALCNSDAVGDLELSCIAAKCHFLKRLCIKGCAISDQGMRGLATGCPRLVKVKIKKCRGVTRHSADWLQIHRPSLILSLDAEVSGHETTEISMVMEETIDAAPVVGLPPSRPRSPFVKVKLALAGSLFRWSTSRGSKGQFLFRTS